MKITDVTGPYREPREQVFSYDYSIQRASWPTAQAVRVKVAIPEELDVLREQDFWGHRRDTGSATHDFEMLVAAYRGRKNPHRRC